MSRDIVAKLAGLLSPASWRSYVANRQSRAFDRRFGTDTRGQVPVAAMVGVDRELALHAVQYEASAIPKFRRALAAVRRSHRNLDDYSFIDFGSGKGLVVMLASQLPFRRVYGVEMTPALHDVAKANLEKFVACTAACAPISLTCADALTFPWPEGNIVAYLYNPFDATLTARFIERLQAEGDRAARSVVVVYVNPAHKSLFESQQRIRIVFEDSTLSVYEYVCPVGEHSVP